ncbi:hypothetical protein ACE1YR_03905 [Pseudomonas sp. K1(2024)]|uniref:Uncharacterized protein n=1 Tax=Pseudomonas boreofloridensis TaxID=3064348 RepID=A0ABV4Z4X8_9PSED|nr:hypothetical protein [Pseudomonas sp. K13]MDO7900821.1 hypothetical protein [Pseudomonas sp. K13]
MAPVQAQLEFSVARMGLPYGAQLRAACSGRGNVFEPRGEWPAGARMQRSQAGVQAM